MFLERLRGIAHFFVPYSLKYRLLILLILSAVIPLALIGSISYLSIHSIQENKVRSGIQNSLNQLGMELENSMNNLNYASQQLAFEGDAVDDLHALESSNDTYTTYYLTKKVTDEMSLIDYTNNQLGLMFYYSPGSTDIISFENLNVKNGFDQTTFPVLFKQMNVIYYGPHASLNRYNSSSLVFSVSRRVDMPDKEMYIYIETNYKLFEDMLKNMQYDMDVIHFLTNDSGKVIFSENPKRIPVGSTYQGNAEIKSSSGRIYYVFRGNSGGDYGLHIMAAVDRMDFNHENYNWIMQFVIFSILSMAFAIFFAWVIWRTIYNPIRVFNREIQYIENNEFNSPLKTMKNKEFDQLFMRFRQMATKIMELIRDVEQKEQAKRYLEAEKMRYKINPHFLHNTLDTVRWMARMNGQADIDHLVSSLNKVLHYNLGKTGEITTIGEEIEILEEYMTVQKMKYDFDFTVRIDADNKVLLIPVPRFILQPLAENSLQHGLKDDLLVRLEVSIAEEGRVRIEIADNGYGITEEKRRMLLGDRADGDSGGLGIGVDYVKSMLKAYYGDSATLDIRSELGQGTVVIILLPDSIQLPG